MASMSNALANEYADTAYLSLGNPSEEAHVSLEPELSHWLPAAWIRYKQKFVQPDGRLVDESNGNVSHSEGQGYGMLLAALAGDRRTFDTIWDWTAHQLMVRPDDLAAWRWDPVAAPHVADMNNATDGDLLIAWALVEASRRWGKPQYRAAARKIALAIGKVVVQSSPYGPILLPGAAGFGADQQPDGPVINLSYWVFPAFESLATVAPEVDWTGLRKSGLRLIEEARFGPVKLPTDWISIKGSTPVPAKSFKPQFGYDAIRIPLYLSWARIRARDHIGSLGGLWNEEDNVGPFVIDASTGSAVSRLDGRGFTAIAALARCVQDGRKVPFDVLADEEDRYFPSTLLLLTKIVVLTRYKQCV